MGVSKKIPVIIEKITVNAIKDSGKCWRRSREMLLKIPVNVREAFRECTKRFGGMFEKVLGNILEDSGKVVWKISKNVTKDSGGCYKRLRGILKRISKNPNFDLFCEIVLFYQILL